jgi:putative membrane protein
LFPLIVGISIYAWVVCWIEVSYLHIGDDSKLKNISILHSMLTFAISTLLVFRANSAYDRWWEGRKLWGALVNNSRNLAMKLNAILPADNKLEREFFKHMIANYAFALKNHLRTQYHEEEFESTEYFHKTFVNSKMHVPNQIAQSIIFQVQQLSVKGVLNDTQLLYINAELTSFTDVCGACERIKNTPIPFSYSVFLKKIIFFFVMTLPFSLAISMSFFCVPVTAFIFYVLTSIELIAEEIENPFGKDANDLPTDTISSNIKKSVHDIFDSPIVQ